jgi:prepilin peptidase CpaA
MFDPNAAALIPIGVLVTLLVCAVGIDLRSHRIPNVICLWLLVAGMAFQTVSGGMQGALLGLGGVIVGLLILLPFYVLRGMGAGDVKLLAASGSFLGPVAALVAGGVTLVGGAVLALGLVAFRAASAAVKSRDVAAAVHSVAVVRKERFPYALPIAVAVVVSLFYADALLATDYFGERP